MICPNCKREMNPERIEQDEQNSKTSILWSCSCGNWETETVEENGPLFTDMQQ